VAAPPIAPALLALAATLAFALGFAAHRASLCNVRAVVEIIGSRRAWILASIFQAAAWAALVHGAVSLVVPAAVVVAVREPAAIAIAGGFLFGTGAAMNGGCSLSTLQRLADGETRSLLTLAGAVSGVAAWVALEWGFGPARPAVAAVQAPAAGLLAVLALLAAAQVWRLWRTRPRGPLWRLPAAETYRLSTAALVIGIGAGLLNLLLGSWTWMFQLRSAIEALGRGGPPPAPAATLLVGALVAGMTASSLQRGGFRLRHPTARDALAALGGGSLMGFGGAMIPGGNDTLVLTGIPAFSAMAAAAYGGMLAGIAAALLAMQALGARLPDVDCASDTCRATR